MKYNANWFLYDITPRPLRAYLEILLLVLAGGCWRSLRDCHCGGGKLALYNLPTTAFSFNILSRQPNVITTWYVAGKEKQQQSPCMLTVSPPCMGCCMACLHDTHMTCTCTCTCTCACACTSRSAHASRAALHSSTCAPAEAYRGKLSFQRVIATILLRTEVKFDTCAQLSEAGS